MRPKAVPTAGLSPVMRGAALARAAPIPNRVTARAVFLQVFSSISVSFRTRRPMRSRPLVERHCPESTEDGAGVRPAIDSRRLMEARVPRRLPCLAAGGFSGRRLDTPSRRNVARARNEFVGLFRRLRIALRGARPARFFNAGAARVSALPGRRGARGPSGMSGDGRVEVEMKRIGLVAVLLVAAIGCVRTAPAKEVPLRASTGEVVPANYLDSSGRDDVLAGGVKMIPIKTPKGTFKVWTKRIGNNRTTKVLLLHGGPG